MTAGFTPKYFKPADAALGPPDARGCITVATPDGRSYVYSPDIVLAVNAALATERPLLVAGQPGTGKSTLAANVAHVLGRKYYERVVTSRTRARDLMWTFDTLNRLADAQPGQGLPPRPRYIEPQVLWWAFDAKGARWRGATAAERSQVSPADDPATGGAGPRAVLLLDEIDKAEPDVPNDLLEALELERFPVEDLDGQPKVQGRKRDLLMIITTNRERELPAAFVRRCVLLDLDRPEADWEDWLVTIANRRFGEPGAKVHREIARRVMALRGEAGDAGRRKPSTAEFLDAVQTCRRLGIGLKSPAWALVAKALLAKGAATAPDDEA